MEFLCGVARMKIEISTKSNRHFNWSIHVIFRQTLYFIINSMTNGGEQPCSRRFVFSKSPHISTTVELNFYVYMSRSGRDGAPLALAIDETWPIWCIINLFRFGNYYLGGKNRNAGAMHTQNTGDEQKLCATCAASAVALSPSLFLKENFRNWKERKKNSSWLSPVDKLQSNNSPSKWN